MFPDVLRLYRGKHGKYSQFLFLSIQAPILGSLLQPQLLQPLSFLLLHMQGIALHLLHQQQPPYAPETLKLQSQYHQVPHISSELYQDLLSNHLPVLRLPRTLRRHQSRYIF